MLGLIQSKIQTGRTTGGTITIEEVSDIRKCIVIVDGNGSGYLTDTTHLSVHTLATYGQGTVSWTVIELGGAVDE